MVALNCARAAAHRPCVSGTASNRLQQESSITALAGKRSSSGLSITALRQPPATSFTHTSTIVPSGFGWRCREWPSVHLCSEPRRPQIPATTSSASPAARSPPSTRNCRAGTRTMPEISGSHGGVALGHELDFRDAQLADAGAARSDVTPGHRGGGQRQRRRVRRGLEPARTRGGTGCLEPAWARGQEAGDRTAGDNL